ncbi:hypothetical protein DCC62_00540 [candidate division KSB1 bacterium]|nr:MAG: hypothetical protein DCC62_00540 [candidate division KSB1 bacterium]
MKALFRDGLKRWVGASIEEYPSSGHELDIFCVTAEGISIYIEIIWTDSKTHFLSDINMLQQSDAAVKLVVGSPGVVEKYQREFSKVVISQGRSGKIIHEEILDGSKILENLEYFENEVKRLILDLIEQAKQVNLGVNDLTRKMLDLVEVKTKFQIRRDALMEAFSSFAFKGNGVVIGPPGVGKTFVLKGFSSNLIVQNVQCLYLPIDKLAIETESALKGELGIKGDFVDYLASQKVTADNTVGILVVDAFDAARSETAQKFFLNLISRVINRLNGKWNVIVSVRTYDAKKSEDLLDLFPTVDGRIPPREFQIKGIHCRHFAIPKLTEIEVRATAATIPHLLAIYERGSTDFKELLKTPFNLWLLEKILSRDPVIPELSSVSSEIQLLGLFWKQRVTDGHLGEDRRVLLTRAARTMVEQRSLSVRTDEIYIVGGNNAWDSLQSSEILVNTSTTAQRVAFSHNILFDYTVSVLLIEDEPEKLVDFVAKDPSRPLFLRPSLSYYFTRLWHSEPDLFWKVFWHILPDTNLHLRLFARLLPPSVIVNEARKIEQLNHLFDSLQQKEPVSFQATVRILQALRALRIERDELWVQFLDKVADHIHQDFASDLAVVTSNILERTEMKHDSIVFKTCGRISRQLLEWIWKQRQQNKNISVDNLGANWVVPVVAKTYITDPRASQQLLGKVLELTKEENFPIQFLYHLTDDLDKIWPFDPGFAALVYLAVFGHEETSEDKTHMGSFVLPMSSTRRQDFEMCHYQLVLHFPKFLLTAPLIASQAAIMCLNQFIVGQHIVGFLREGTKIEDLPEEFSFRGKNSYYVPDASYIWDQSKFPDQTIQMADELFKFITKLASSPDSHSLLDSLLDVFRDYAWMAFFWRRLLRAATEAPKVFASRLFELCIARPIMMGSEALHELGSFLEVAALEFTDDQLRKIEETILSIPNNEADLKRREYLEHRRDRLLARIPAELLKTDAARVLRKAMQEVPNEPLVEFESSISPYNEDEWLKEQGADLSLSENKALQKFFIPLDNFTSEWRNQKPSTNTIEMILPVAKQTYAALDQDTGADAPVINKAWTKLASCTATMSRGTTDPNSDAFQFCREILLLCAEHNLPEPDPIYDGNYNSPGWSPAPRNEAAQGLPWLAARNPDTEILEAIEMLVHDKVPSVRFLAAMELWRFSISATEFFWRLANEIAENEGNRVVHLGLCNTFNHVVECDEQRTVEVLKKLVKNALTPDEDYDFVHGLVSLIVWLILARENDWAFTVTETFLEEPIHYAKTLERATFDVLHYLTPQQFDSHLGSPSIAERAIGWLAKAINASAKGVRELRIVSQNQWDEKAQSKLRDVYGIIDKIVLHLYFSADFRKDDGRRGRIPATDEQRRTFYFKIKPLLVQILEVALDEENGFMFARTAHHFMELLNGVLKYDPKGVLHMATNVAQSSRRFGYNLDSLAIKDVVKLVEAILADYRAEVRDGDSLQDLLNLLDIFAETGWPDALRLVWRLDEVFR